VVLSIPQLVEIAIVQLSSSQISLAGIVAAGEPIEPIPQTERVEVPKSMVGRGDTFALRVKGSSMRDEGILSGDVGGCRSRARPGMARPSLPW
jgi:repressor LexA